MIKFKSLDEFVTITKECQTKGFKNINCYLMPNEIIELINKDALYYLINDSTLQIIIKSDRYIKVAFYATELKVIPFDSECPIITDLPYTIKMNDRLLNIKESLLTQGFEVNSTTTRMSCPIFEAEDSLHGYKIEKLQNHDIDKVYNLWEATFDNLLNLLYSKKEILEYKNQIYVLKNQEDELLGAMEIIINGNSGWVQHIAINPDFQGKGLGSILENFYINECKSLGIKTLLLYTIDSKLQAQRFHSKFGFKPDGKYNCQFVYRRK